MDEKISSLTGDNYLVFEDGVEVSSISFKLKSVALRRGILSDCVLENLLLAIDVDFAHIFHEQGKILAQLLVLSNFHSDCRLRTTSS